MTAPDLAAGCRNLLLNCARLEAGQSVLIVQEDPALGWYDREMAEALAAEVRSLGAEARVLQVAGPEVEADAIRVDDASADHDCIVYLARLGDMDRFEASTDGKTRVMSYARNAGMLASPYGTTDHQVFLDLKEAVNDVLLGADRILVTCPLGTNLSGTVTDRERENAADVKVRRFPMGVPQPVIASTFSGKVALARYLTPTGSQPYEPAALKIASPVFAIVENGRIAGFEGDTDTVDSVKAHYKVVSEKFGIDRDAIHSWHAGIHPACAYEGDAARDPDHWSNTVFTNPRFLHVHTCGAYPPGEICWMVLDHTVEIDGVKLWEKGRLLTDTFGGISACVEKWSVLKDLFDAPSDRIGIAA
ncbi:MAG: hypothetical protein ACPGRZ_03590 [Alphaproteobacteria bacterium]